MILNILQNEALKCLADTHGLGQKAGLVILPPGSGKTRIAAEDAKGFGARQVLYVAHTNEILDVAQSEFEAKFATANVVRIDSPQGLKSLGTVNITTIQLISRNLKAISPDTFDYVVVDEFHHAAAKSYRSLVEKLRPKFLLGLTATPFRGDRQDILQLCDGNVLVEYELRSGIEMGILCPYHYFGCFDDVDYTKIGSNGNYTIHDLERALIVPERDQAIISKWKSLADGKPTLAFCCTIKHAERVAASFTAAGVHASVYTHETTKEERKQITEKFQSGALTLLCVVDVLNEGADLPFIECLLFLRPTDSKRIFYQQLGRGLRRYVGKSHCTAVDFIGNFQNAYRIVEYQGLLPFADDEGFTGFGRPRSRKEILNLPLGCEVHFDDRVIDLFARQTLNPLYATRHNIGRILIYQYERLAKRLGRKPTKKDVDRNLLINSDFYAAVFGSWKAFEQGEFYQIPTNTH